MSTEDNYYGAVESHFIERRGSPLFITPKEWHLIQKWETESIPLRVVKEGIDRVFERPSRRPGVRRLSYCRQSVEAAFRRFREARVGESGGGSSEHEDAERLVAAEHLAELRTTLEAARKIWSKRSEDFARQLEDGIREIETLGESESVDRPGLETRLIGLEERLLGSAASVLAEEEREDMRRRAEESLSSYRERMPEDVYRGALDSAYRKRVRAACGLCPMSLYSR